MDHSNKLRKKIHVFHFINTTLSEKPYQVKLYTLPLHVSCVLAKIINIKKLFIKINNKRLTLIHFKGFYLN